MQKQSEVSDIVDANTKTALLKNILVKNHPNGDLKFFVMPVMQICLILLRNSGSVKKRLMKYNELKIPDWQRMISFS
jgi:hypothetical protein